MRGKLAGWRPISYARVNKMCPVASSGAMRTILRVVVLLAILALPQFAPAQDTDIPVSLRFEQAEAGTARVRSRDGGWFQVIPPGGLDDQEEYLLEAVVRPGATVKFAGGGSSSSISKSSRWGTIRSWSRTPAGRASSESSAGRENFPTAVRPLASNIAHHICNPTLTDTSLCPHNPF